MPKKTTKHKKIGLTLGGGGAKGLAHLGVYSVLEEYKIPIDYLTGCSIGSVAAAVIAQGMPAKEALMVMGNFSKHKHKLLSPRNFGFKRGSLLKGDDIHKAMSLVIPEKLTFKDLKIPLKINAVDAETGKEVVIDKGNVLQAVMASSAIPGVYPPVFFQDKLLVDGGVLNNIPADICREMGADKVIAVDLKSLVSEQNISGLIYHFYIQKQKERRYHLSIRKKFLKEIGLRIKFPITLMLRSMSISQDISSEQKLKASKPDILIHPEVSNFTFVDFDRFLEIYEKGREAALTHLDEFEKLKKTH
jgi:NTE family protein